MSDEDGLVHAYVLDGAGGARRVEWPGVRGWRPGTGTLWVHVDRGGALVKQWLAEESGIEPLVVSALIAEETRPRSVLSPSGLLVILRGVNHNPGAQPEDMVSLRTWIDVNRVVTVRRRRLKAVLDVQASRDCREDCAVGTWAPTRRPPLLSCWALRRCADAWQSWLRRAVGTRLTTRRRARNLYRSSPKIVRRRRRCCGAAGRPRADWSGKAVAA